MLLMCCLSKFLIFLLILNVFYLSYIKCEVNKAAEIDLSKNDLPYFRRKVEEIIDNNSSSSRKDDFHNKLVSFLINNVKEIFKGVDDEFEIYNLTSKDNKHIQYKTKNAANEQNITGSTMFTGTTAQNENIASTESPTQLLCTSTHTTTNKSFSLTTFAINELEAEDDDNMFNVNTNITDTIETFENLSNLPMPFLINRIAYGDVPIILKSSRESTINYPFRTPKDLLFLGKQGKESVGDTTTVNLDQTSENVMTFITEPEVVKDPKRSCIMCDNVSILECSQPKNKLIPSSVCNYEDSLCYSQHTPFGIVDRGCYNINHNMTIYVCACNLCNYASITDMPIIFSSKKDWMANVFELSHARRLKKSVFKDMSCLRCEVNSTAGGDPVENSNCLEGRIATLPTQECSEGEICGVRSIKSQGYMWRGCLRSPYYNYYMTLCDSDLCNYENLVSVYDLI